MKPYDMSLFSARVRGKVPGLVGMLTDRDIVIRSTAAGENPATATVEAVMTTDVRSCFADTAVEELLELMQGLQIRRVPVVEGDQRLIGIVSLGDLATDSPRVAPKPSRVFRFRHARIAEPDAFAVEVADILFVESLGSEEEMVASAGRRRVVRARRSRRNQGHLSHPVDWVGATLLQPCGRGYPVLRETKARSEKTVGQERQKERG